MYPSWKNIRHDFPILHQQVHGKPLVYLDNAATAQKPRSVIDALVRYYEPTTATCIGLAHAFVRATAAYEGAAPGRHVFIYHSSDPSGSSSSLHDLEHQPCLRALGGRLQPGDVISHRDEHTPTWFLAQIARPPGTLRYVPIVASMRGRTDLKALNTLSIAGEGFALPCFEYAGDQSASNSAASRAPWEL